MFIAETSQNGTRGITIAPTRSTSHHTMPMMPMPAAGAPGVVAGPTTNFNIGMEYWVSSTSSAIPPVNGKVPATVSAGIMVPGALVGANEKVPPEIWLQVFSTLLRYLNGFYLLIILWLFQFNLHGLISESHILTFGFLIKCFCLSVLKWLLIVDWL